MAIALSSTDIAISIAVRRGTIRLTERMSRFGDTYVAISDDYGIIEVVDNISTAEARVRQAAH